MQPRLAVIAFPGNNCEIESARAAARNGFEAAIIRWNEPHRLADFHAFLLPGGFSFEDRVRSGAIAAREPIFDALRAEAKKGKVILGICNGAQMVVESGLIPWASKALPLALAPNIRRSERGEVIGTGYYNTWSYITPVREHTAFTRIRRRVLHVPIAHGEGRFVSRDESVLESLKDNTLAGYKYCDAKGHISEAFPITPNGAAFATAMVINKEGTIGAMMPHPERFYTTFDGDEIFQSMYQWIVEKRSPSSVTIGNLSQAGVPPLQAFLPEEDTAYIAVSLIITDNTAFSLSQVLSRILGKPVKSNRKTLFAIKGGKALLPQLLKGEPLFNPNKERGEVFTAPTTQEMLVKLYEDDAALALSEKLSAFFKTPLSVEIYQCWEMGDLSQEDQRRILQNQILANPHSAAIYLAENHPLLPTS